MCAAQCRPLPERWSRELLEQIRAAPWRNPAPSASELPLVVLPPLPADARLVPPPAPLADPAPTRVYIRKEDLERWGYTGCLQMCAAHPAAGTAHAPECRARIKAATAEAGDA